jgi:hypothetical protein
MEKTLKLNSEFDLLNMLFWVTSPKSKHKPYHLTRTRESILRKLIEFDSENPNINHSNKIISERTFIKTSTIEKVIPALIKMGYIKTITSRINDGSGQINYKRIIKINWKFIKKIMSDVPVIIIEETIDEHDDIYI